MSRGNTKSRHYIFTINNPKEVEIKLFKEHFYKYTCQLEQGKEGTVHLQGVGTFKNPRSFNKVKKSFPRAHIEVCKCIAKAIDYCSKSDTRLKGPWSTHKIILKDYFDGGKMKPWQKEIIDICNSSEDNRKIYWYWEPIGKVGKSVLARHIAMTVPNALLVSGKMNDIKFAVSCMVKEGKQPSVVIWDLAREQKISYMALETVKNGAFFSNKYESGMVLYNRPIIIVLANYPPDMLSLSIDRWIVRDVSSSPPHPPPIAEVGAPPKE